MNLDVRKKGPVSILDISGRFTIPHEARVREAMLALLDAGERLFIFNMTKCPYLDSSGLGETVACLKRVSSRKGTIKLVLTEKPLAMFVLTGLDRVFEIFEDEEEALASFIVPSPPE
jgi:anti-sigma B factor antagonist